MVLLLFSMCMQILQPAGRTTPAGTGREEKRHSFPSLSRPEPHTRGAGSPARLVSPVPPKRSPRLHPSGLPLPSPPSRRDVPGARRCPVAQGGSSKRRSARAQGRGAQLRAARAGTGRDGTGPGSPRSSGPALWFLPPKPAAPRLLPRRAAVRSLRPGGCSFFEGAGKREGGGRRREGAEIEGERSMQRQEVETATASAGD